MHQGDSRGLVDYYKLRLAELAAVGGVDVLNGLAMRLEDIDADDGAVELGVRGLHQLIVEVLLVANRVKALEYKLKQRAQVLWRRRGDKNVGVSV